jgi:hypothetical protein
MDVMFEENFDMNGFSRHVRTALSSAVVVPPAASLLLLATVLLPTSSTWGDPLSAVPSFLELFFFFAVPVGYVFGAIPALLAGAIYSAMSTAMPSVQPPLLLRGGLGAVCGGLTGGVWFHAVVGAGSFIYTLAAALMMALFAICRTRGAVAGSTLHMSAMRCWQLLTSGRRGVA